MNTINSLSVFGGGLMYRSTTLMPERTSESHLQKVS